MNKEPVIGKYILVHPYELADIPNPGFPWKGRSEEDVRDFLSDQRVQNYFLSFNEDDPTFHKAYMVDNTDLTFVFTDFYAPRYCGHPVSVVKTPDGYAYCTDGRHRLYVTKKYNLLIIGLYQGEVSYNPCRIAEKPKIRAWQLLKNWIHKKLIL